MCEHGKLIGRCGCWFDPDGIGTGDEDDEPTQPVRVPTRAEILHAKARIDELIARGKEDKGDAR